MASMTVVGVFDNASEAQQAVEALVSDGFSRSNIDLSTAQTSGSQSYSTGDYNSGSGSSGNVVPDRHQNTSGTMAEEVVDDTKDVASRVGDSVPDRHRNTSGTMAEEVVDDTKDVGSSIGNFFSSLFGLDDDNADRYTRVAERSSIVTVHAQSEDEAERAADILDDNGAVDVDERAATYGSTIGSGLTGAGTAMGTGLVDNTTNTANYDRTNVVDGDQKIQVVEENLQVGKRQVETGGVRVRSRIVERPVEENLRLREERVVVQRNPVNRPATDADLTTFQEGEIELRETAERAVVSKTANVVEEISIGKEVNEREETIRDTVRKTEVDVENLASNEQTFRTDQTGDTNRTGNTGTGFNTDGTTYSNR